MLHYNPLLRQQQKRDARNGPVSQVEVLFTRFQASSWPHPLAPLDLKMGSGIKRGTRRFSFSENLYLGKLEIEIGNPVHDIKEQEGSGKENSRIGVQAGNVDADPALSPHPCLTVLNAAKEPLAFLPFCTRGAQLFTLIIFYLWRPVQDAVDIDGSIGGHHVGVTGWLEQDKREAVKKQRAQPPSSKPPSLVQEALFGRHVLGKECHFILQSSLATQTNLMPV